eukprot:scaffold10265_cov58-Phaeocystis_antarctica.AAC.4
MRARRAARVTGWPSWVRCEAPRPRAKGAGRPFWGVGTRRPGLHGPRCARLTSIVGLSGAVEHAGGASRMSFVDPRRSPFRALGLAMHAPERSALRLIRVSVDEARSPPT